MKIVPVILAGGIGERFWPLSRSSRPKQFLPLISKLSMLEETMLRGRSFSGRNVTPLVVTGKNLAAKIPAVLSSKMDFDVIAEPEGKNTAPAIAIAAAWIKKKYGDAVMAVLPADHAISPRKAFADCIRFGAALATANGSLVVFGIKPGRPDTGYGYIQRGDADKTTPSLRSFKVKTFVEKPDIAKARKYVSSGRYFWNSGMFVFTASSILSQFETHIPKLFSDVENAAKAGFSNKAIDHFYTISEKESIDYGIMERAKNVVMVEANFTWDDVGSWEAVGRLRASSGSSTTVVGTNVFESDNSGSIIYNSDNKPLAVMGLENVVVVSSGDVTMVISKEKLPQIKTYLAQIKKCGFPEDLF